MFADKPLQHMDRAGEKKTQTTSGHLAWACLAKVQNFLQRRRQPQATSANEERTSRQRTEVSAYSNCFWPAQHEPDKTN